jgi:hypothetical protein
LVTFAGTYIQIGRAAGAGYREASGRQEENQSAQREREVTMKLIKTTGLVIAMAMALTALLGAASASASQFRAEEYPATATGTQGSTAGTVQKFKTASGIVIECETATTAGTMSEASSTLTLTPTYSKCTLSGQAATASVNTCKYAFHSTNEKAPYTGSMDVACGKEGDAIEFTQLSSGCQVKIPAQSALGSVAFANSGSSRSRAITVTLNVTGLKYTESSKCPKGGGTHENGTYTGSSVVKGINEKAGHAVGVYLANEQVADPLLLEGESYPLIVRGEQQGSPKFGIQWDTFECFGQSKNEISGSMSEFSQNVELYECNAALNMHSCYFTLHPTTGESPLATGSMGIACKEEGAAITFTVFGSCEVKFPTQSGLNSVYFENTGKGTSRGIHLEMKVSALKYTESSSCPHPGTHENGTLSGSWNLKGFESILGIEGSQEGIWIE